MIDHYSITTNSLPPDKRPLRKFAVAYLKDGWVETVTFEAEDFFVNEDRSLSFVTNQIRVGVVAPDTWFYIKEIPNG